MQGGSAQMDNIGHRNNTHSITPDHRRCHRAESNNLWDQVSCTDCGKLHHSVCVHSGHVSKRPVRQMALAAGRAWSTQTSRRSSRKAPRSTPPCRRQKSMCELGAEASSLFRADSQNKLLPAREHEPQAACRPHAPSPHVNAAI